MKKLLLLLSVLIVTSCQVEGTIYSDVPVYRPYHLIESDLVDVGISFSRYSKNINFGTTYAATFCDEYSASTVSEKEYALEDLNRWLLGTGDDLLLDDGGVLENRDAIFLIENSLATLSDFPAGSLYCPHEVLFEIEE